MTRLRALAAGYTAGALACLLLPPADLALLRDRLADRVGAWQDRRAWARYGGDPYRGAR
jgi:hypothetical protein